MNEYYYETYSSPVSTQRTPFPAKTSLAMAYVPFQQWEKPYSAEAGLDRGTLFPSLDLPFLGEEAFKRG